jgi:hypothetical protein
MRTAAARGQVNPARWDRGDVPSNSPTPFYRLAPGFCRFLMDESLDRFRTALKFSLWVWALYWPLGGLLLLGGGLDPISIAVTFGSLGSFIVLIGLGALRTQSKHNWREFLLERPIYLIAGAILLIALAPIFSPVENVGLRLFATAYLAGMGLAAYRLYEHVRASGKSILASRADQAFLMFGMTGAAALMVFLDAWLPAFGSQGVGSSTLVVAVSNWVNLFYPALLLIATRPFRQPLGWTRTTVDPAAPTPAATPAAPAPLDAPILAEPLAPVAPGTVVARKSRAKRAKSG